MQKKIIATIAVASVIITGISCKWFASKEADKAPFSLVGKWQVDSVYQIGSDSTKNWLALAFLDSTIAFKFNADSTFNILSAKDSAVTALSYILTGDSLFVKDDSLLLANHLIKTNDSLVTITTNDSLAIILKRQ